LPAEWLADPAPNPKLRRLDFKKLGFPEYDGFYAVIIDNVLSQHECDQFVAAAEQVGEWERAMINIGGGRQALEEDVRKCGRIIWDNQEVMNRVWARVKPLVPELEVLDGWSTVTGRRRGKDVFTRFNERMRFLKYGPGGYFKRDCPFPASSFKHADEAL